MSVRWSAPVRYSECDDQRVVFNAHYLVWADEASNAWWPSVGLRWDPDGVCGVQPLVKASSLEWSSSAVWGDVVDVVCELEGIGRTSLTLVFEVRVGDRLCCTVRSTYVATRDGVAVPWPDEVRAAVS
ncbi:thioesterase family protein [Klenkia sp. PcliD-1-E]|uniref:acyl-CoA thioesterase n=1 Tax=Klenkia sp. PcliD-1-E TaxID=2954492 RepID=UPI002096F8CE|nr:thioesterase family protein [Klenkia sp. PcliD-1-E]MCO7221623.1 acyl-CoA thioesterase [Klenkia sp. PcliD-1-E]